MTKDSEIPLFTKSSGFHNANGKIGGQFKRFGLDSHAGIAPHVHQPIRNPSPKGVFGTTGSKTANGGVTSPSKKDISQLYSYFYNGKYQ